MYEFNLRDIKLFSTYEERFISTKASPKIVHNIIMSCFKNGLLFFQISSKTMDKVLDSISYEKNNWRQIDWLKNHETSSQSLWISNQGSQILELTYRMSFSETGRLFTFTDYFNAEIDETPFYVYITHSTLPAVHEVAIDSHFNVNFVRSYIVYNEYKGRLIGSDVLSVNQVYVAHLMFDLERMIEIVRIYYRNSSNFAYGHADILLNKFITRVSVVSFLDYSDNPYIFVQNSCLGVLYKINDLKFEIDTVNIKEKYSKYSNKTYRVDMLAYNEEKETEKAFMTFKITFVSQEDMNTYFTGNFDTYYFGYSYGDTSFSKVISDYYMGPDLKFNLTLKSNSSYIRSLILPNITKTQEKSNVREFHTSDECNQSFFNRYGNVETGIENIAFYCIQNSLIEEHIFRTKDLIETKKEIYEYSRYKFIDFYVNLNENSDSIDFTDLLVVLGIQQNYYENLYFLHYFELKNDAITWRRKVSYNCKIYRFLLIQKE